MFRRGQMEIFGLVIIVILLAIGLLFAIVMLTKTPTGEVERVKQSVQAANFLNTMLGTTTDCADRTVRELIQDCAVSNYGQGAKCNGKDTCETAHETITKMLSKTLGEWGRQYKFYINGTPSVEKLEIQTGKCTGEREGSSRPEKIRPGMDVTVTLHICRD
ncbi:hypothetical protein KY319_02840 [Candidatus Woesearchaeota archaeon]|nr:hypothetical protein [Candidatus Woesearchaeota archaeon]